MIFDRTEPAHPAIADQEVADLIAEVCDYSPYAGSEPLSDARYKLERAFARLEQEVCDLKRSSGRVPKFDRPDPSSPGRSYEIGSGEKWP